MYRHFGADAAEKVAMNVLLPSSFSRSCIRMDGPYGVVSFPSSARLAKCVEYGTGFKQPVGYLSAAKTCMSLPLMNFMSTHTHWADAAEMHERAAAWHDY